jgi:hypothetical protein
MPRLAFAGVADGEPSAARLAAHLAFCAADRLPLAVEAEGKDVPGTSPPTSRKACNARSIAAFTAVQNRTGLGRVLLKAKALRAWKRGFQMGVSHFHV